MAELTKNFGLIKPLPEEFYDVNVFNENMNILDTELADLSKIPVTSEVPENADIWIDPNNEATEETHIMDKNNPHGVTAEQIGAITRTLLWENAYATSDFESQDIDLNGDYDGFEIVYYDVILGMNLKLYSSGYLPKLAGIPYRLMACYLGSGIGFYYRDVTIAYHSMDDYVCSFSDGYYHTSGSNENVFNKCIIPLQIYGIKGVK